MAPVWRDAAGFVSVQAAFQALPADVRVLVGPGFAARLIDAGHPVEARVIYDTTVRSGGAQDAALELVGARLAALDGHPTEAAQAMAALVEKDAGGSVDALADLVRLALEQGMEIPDKTVTDLRAAALQYRGTAEEATLRGLLAEALARRGELSAAVAEARAAAIDLPGQTAAFDALAVRLMAEADPAAVGAAAYAGTVLDAADVIAAAAADDPARTTIARQLVALGLPDPALAMIAPTLSQGAMPARLVAAEARIRKGEGAEARVALGPLAGPESAAVRARAFALDGISARRGRRWRAAASRPGRNTPGSRATGGRRGRRLRVTPRGRRWRRGWRRAAARRRLRRRTRQSSRRMRPFSSRCRRSTGPASGRRGSCSRPGRRWAASSRASWPATECSHFSSASTLSSSCYCCILSSRVNDFSTIAARWRPV